MKILVTGAAGFIGFHLINKLLAAGHYVTGLDCINDYYDINLKYDRLKSAGIAKEKIYHNIIITSDQYPSYQFVKLQLEEKKALHQLFAQQQFECVVNLAAQAGVRYSLENPYAYVECNINGFINILEGCRHYGVKHLIYASTSSVYGLNEKNPFSTHESSDHPMSLYAATKKSNELMAHSYSHLFNLATTGLRFFTVYGPWGRPDMAPFLFTKAISDDKPIHIYNNGNMTRDFTYIDDIVEGVSRVVQHPAEPNPAWNPKYPDPATSSAPYRIYNIGNNNPVNLMDFVSIIEEQLGKSAKKIMMPIQASDMPATCSDVTDLIRDLGYKPTTSIQTGMKNFIEWYKQYYINYN